MSYIKGGKTITAYKTADETKTSDITLTIDTDLQIELDTNSTYSFSLFLAIDAGGYSPDFKFDFTYPVDGVGFTTVGANTTADDAKFFNVVKNIAAIPTATKSLFCYGTISTVTGGTFGVNWAQQVSHVESITLNKDSTLQIRKLN